MLVIFTYLWELLGATLTCLCRDDDVLDPMVTFL